MKNDDDDKITNAEQDDAQLSAYFEARDGVSATYHALGDEVPADELNARILDAARIEVSDDNLAEAKKPFFNIGYYPMAASVLLTMFVVTVYVNNKPADLLEAIEVREQGELEQQRVQRVQREQGEIESDTVVAEILFDLAAPEIERELVAPEAVRTRIISDTNEPAAIQREQEVEEIAIENLQFNFLEEADSEINEIVVAGSRVVQTVAAQAPAEDNSFNYRNSIDEWLEEILFLLEEDVEAAELESELFMQAHPDVELTPTLNQLRNNQ